MTPSLAVRSVSGLALTQDAGRPGYAHLGVPRAGALDKAAAELANRLVGNEPEAAVVELTMGELTLTPTDARWFAVTGSRCPVTVDGHPVAHGRAEWGPAGAELALGMPVDGARTYLAVGGGVAVPPVLGSRSTDTLAWVGPAPVSEGAALPLGPGAGQPTPLDVPPPDRRTGILRVDPGPRVDWFSADALDHLCGTRYDLLPSSNRVGLRLDGPPLRRVRDDELPTEGMVLGSVQVPPDGRPVVFLADHPPTGGYPVLAVVREDDLDQCAQLRPGDPVRFARA